MSKYNPDLTSTPDKYLIASQLIRYIYLDSIVFIPVKFWREIFGCLKGWKKNRAREADYLRSSSLTSANEDGPPSPREGADVDACFDAEQIEK